MTRSPKWVRLLCVTVSTVLLWVPGVPCPAGARDRKRQTATYLLVPIDGHVGEEAVAQGLEHCLWWADRNPRIRHIVLRVNSAGGSFEEAEGMVEILKKYEDRFTYHALVKKAAGPAVCLVICCHTIHVSEGAVVGGGDLRPGWKVGEVLVARMGAIARAKKHPFPLVRAMLVPPAEAYVWRDEAGELQITPYRPKRSPGIKGLWQHRGGGLANLAHDYAVITGFADGRAETAEELGDVLGFSEWISAGAYGEGAMNRMRLNRKREAEKAKTARDLLARNTAARRDLIEYIDTCKEEALENDPARFKYKLERGPSGVAEYTGESTRRWRQRSKDAINAWQRVRDAAGALIQLERQAVQLGGKRIEAEVNLSNIYSRALREIKRLEEQRAYPTL